MIEISVGFRHNPLLSVSFTGWRGVASAHGSKSLEQPMEEEGMSGASTQGQSLKVEDLFSVQGKVAVVTGGSRGLGRTMAEAYVANGVKVYISSRNKEACEQTADELSKMGECISLPANLSTNEGRALLVGEVTKREETLDILVNNAGAVWGAPFDDFPEEGYDKVMDLNVKSVFMLTRDFLPLLEKAGRPGDPARVINIGSMDGIRVPNFIDNFSYCPSKAAVHHMTRVFASRFGKRGISFNAIAPGPFETKMTEWMLDTYQERLEAAAPLGRIGSPPDIAGVALYLASRAGAYVTGTVIPIDGGLCVAWA